MLGPFRDRPRLDAPPAVDRQRAFPPPDLLLSLSADRFDVAMPATPAGSHLSPRGLDC